MIFGLVRWTGTMLLQGAAALAVGTTLAGSGWAQKQAVVVGTVTEAGTGQPLGDVRIIGVTQRVRARTDRFGFYRLDRVSEGELIIRLEASGFPVVTEQIQIQQTDTMRVNLQLSRVDGLLSQMMTGRLPRPAEATLQASGVVEPDRERGAPEQLGMQQPGIQVQQIGGGQVGAGTAVQIRGVKSFIQANDPIIIVDGIRVSGGSPSGTLTRVRIPSVLDLLDPSSIERVEVLRGLTAGAQYGEGAINGVVLIYTKNGAGAKISKP